MDKKQLTMPSNIQKKIESLPPSGNREDSILNQGPTYLKGVGELIGESLAIFKNNFWVFIGLVAIISVISLLIPYSFGSFWADKTGGIIKIIVQRLLIAFVGAVGSVFLLFAIKEKKSRIYKSFKESLSKIIPFIWISILVGIVVFIGVLLLIIPGIIFGVWFSLAVYILISEGLKGFDAMSKSKQLVEGYWWDIFWRYLVLIVLSTVLGMIFNFILSRLLFQVIIKSVSYSAGAVTITGYKNIIVMILFSLIRQIFQWLWLTFTFIYGFLIYENLKGIKKL